MRSLAPGTRISEHGIVFDRLKNGDGRFSVNIMVDGQRIHRVLGRESDGTTRTQAEQFINQLRTDAKHHRLSLPKGRKRELTFSEAAEKYMQRLEAGDGRDLKQKKHRLDLHLKPFFSNKPLSKISTYDVERYKKHRKAEKAIKRKLPDGSLTDREVYGPSKLGKYGFPDGIAFDAHGNLWGTLVMVDQVFAITPEGDYHVILDDTNEQAAHALEKAFVEDRATPDDMLAAGGTIAPWFASVTFGGPDLRTAYIGSLRGTRIPYFRSPVAGLPMVHWK